MLKPTFSLPFSSTVFCLCFLVFYTLYTLCLNSYSPLELHKGTSGTRFLTPFNSGLNKFNNIDFAKNFDLAFTNFLKVVVIDLADTVNNLFNFSKIKKEDKSKYLNLV